MKKKPTKLLSSLMGGEKRRHYVAAYVTNEGEWNQHEPNTGFAKMFIAMLILHVLIIGGIILSDSGTKKTAPRSPAAAAMMTKGKDEISGTRVASVVETSGSADGAKYETYQVRSGDSLPMIVARLGVDKDELIALNGLEEADFGAGMTLKIPNKKVTAPLQVSAARPLNVGITTPTSTPVAIHTEPQADTTAASASDAPTAAPAEVNAVADASSPPEKSAADVVVTSATDGGNGLVPLPDVAISTSTEPAVEPLKVEESPPPASSKPEPSSKSDNVVSTEKPKEQEKEKPVQKKTVAAVAAPRPVPPPSEMTKRPINKTDKSDKADSPPKTTAKSETKSTKSGASYTMAKGDTLYRISAKFGVSVQSLMKANNVKDPAKIRDGTKLVIPSKS